MSPLTAATLVALLSAPALVAAQSGWPTADCPGQAGQSGEVSLGLLNIAATAEEMAQNLLSNSLNIVTLNTATLIGANSQSGRLDYCAGSSTHDWLANGGTGETQISVFTTGNGSVPAFAPTPGSPDEFGGFANENYANNDRYTVVAGTPGVAGPNSPLGAVCLNKTSGVASNDFESSGIRFTTTANANGELQFTYLFASDEYPEYVPRDYKDQMRFLARVNGGPWTNLAKVPGSDLDVGIDTINGNVNSDLYYANDPSLMVDNYTPFPSQYDGITDLLTTNAVSFEQGDTIEFAFFVTDCNDRNVDSAILLQGSIPTFINTPPACLGDGVSIVPNPSSPGDEITITVSVIDDAVPASAVCTMPSGAVATCSEFTAVPDQSGAYTCVAFASTLEEDYTTNGGVVTCTTTDAAGATVECDGALELLPPPSPRPITPPVCAPNAVIVNPNPSSPGDTVVTTFSVIDDGRVSSAVCLYPGSSTPVACESWTYNDATGSSTCTAARVTTGADYVDGGVVSCTATDSDGLTVTCSAPITRLPDPSPAPPPPPPSPQPPIILPSPTPDGGVCRPPTVPEPVTPPNGGSPFTTPCWIMTENNTIVDYSVKTCSQCQWQCLTLNNCARVAMWTADNVYEREALGYLNCGDGGWDNGAMLCVLIGTDGSFLYPDTQNQGCQECRQQCLWWDQCAGVYYQYTLYMKPALDDELCC